MTEGCTGGWAVMNGFFAENAGLVAEDCAPYKAFTKGYLLGILKLPFGR